MRTYILFLLMSGLFLSCKKNKLPTNNGYDPNKPSFRVGTRWTIRFTSYASNGSIVFTQDQQIKIVRETIINGSRYLISDDSSYFSNKSDGYYQYDKNANKEILWYKYPVLNLESYLGQFPTAPQQASCFLSFSALVNNTDTSRTANGKTYDKLIYYTFNVTTTCQGTPTYTKELFSTKLGLRILYSSYVGLTTTLANTLELVSFTY